MDNTQLKEILETLRLCTQANTGHLSALYEKLKENEPENHGISTALTQLADLTKEIENLYTKIEDF